MTCSKWIGWKLKAPYNDNFIGTLAMISPDPVGNVGCEHDTARAVRNKRLHRLDCCVLRFAGIWMSWCYWTRGMSCQHVGLNLDTSISDSSKWFELVTFSLDLTRTTWNSSNNNIAFGAGVWMFWWLQAFLSQVSTPVLRPAKKKLKGLKGPPGALFLQNIEKFPSCRFQCWRAKNLKFPDCRRLAPYPEKISSSKAAGSNGDLVLLHMPRKTER